jgi:hypothetical protein
MLFHENQRRIQSLLRDCTKAESRNGKAKRETTKEDLDALFDRIVLQQDAAPEADRVDFWNQLARDPALHEHYFGDGGEDRKNGDTR